MKSGRIEQYKSYSQFSTLEQFNESNKMALDIHGHHLTKGERIAFDVLTRFSVKVLGVCNARICKLVQACQDIKGGISRSTFERMLRKAKSLGIISILHTVRETGGYSHNVYIFNRFDTPNQEQLTSRKNDKNPQIPTANEHKKQPETHLVETKTLKDKDLRQEQVKTIDQINMSDLDHSFVPDHIPAPFVKAIKPFFNRAKDICGLWDRAQIAYRSAKFPSTTSIDSMLPTIVHAFKQTVYRYKQNRIQTGFVPYFYGTVANLLTVEKRKMVAEDTQWGLWLEG
ncbi:hypothetical protein [Alkalihalobacterium chitinilyticum]|uniref:Helix-turn-helix domain-containing protein n=1 Tax=Alkalihalobacterium chitinilyticum TaxID=2980103 RepID=A0ABT5VFF3_9BACI|nr:hypothetical protein [Alkalihalobacterium chitinilyticum]MDE5414187.1 hypothetical protein [Alkalihalobacterium chitinilyticum]